MLILTIKGYFGLYKKRTSAKEDGCATFFRHEKFCLEAFRYLEYHHKDVPALNHDNVALLLLLKPNLHPRESDPRPGNPHVDPTLHSTALPPIDQAKKVLLETLNFHVQLISFHYCIQEQLKDLTLCVANTHLLFNPLRGEVKLAQLMTLLAAIDDLKAEHKCTTIICGDFNSTPYSGLYKFVLNGRVECKDVDLKFFSGQIKPTPEDLQEANLRKPLSPLFLQKLSLTDQCQFVEVLKKRYEKNAEGTSTQSTKDFFMDEEDETALPPFSYTQGSGVITHDFDFETVFDHSNYNDNQPHVKEVSFFLETNCSKVDYIFYSQTANQKRSFFFQIPSLNINQKNYLNNFLKFDQLYKPRLFLTGRRKAQKDTTSTEPEPSPSSPNELTLLRKLKLWTEAEIRNKYTSGMPNSGLGSDHLIMLAEFGVKLS